jgi:hypothetical protein
LNKETYEAWSRTIAFTLKLVGILGIIFVPVFWAFTDRIELAFLPFFGTLAGVGQGLDVLREISQNRGGVSGTNEASNPP